MDRLSQFKSYEVSAKDGVHTVKLYDKELDKYFNASGPTLTEAIELVITQVQEKKQELKQSDMLLAEQKQTLMDLNKGPLIYKILGQICMESYPPQYSTSASLTMADGTTVQGRIGSWNEVKIEKMLYGLMYEKVFPKTESVTN